MSAPADAALLARLAAQVETWTGIAPGRGGAQESLARWVASRTRELGLPSAAHYVAALAGEERERLVRAVTVGWTWFFRDAEQLAAIEALLRDGFPAGRPLELWVAGCSTGEDAFSLAMIAAEVGRPVRVLATDLNEASLDHARAGRYGSWALRELPPRHRARLIAEGPARFRVDEALRAGVTFARHNVLDAPPPTARGFDLVLCRNVLIYFEPARAAETLLRLGGALSADGWLLLGASEVLSSAPPGLALRELRGRTGLVRAATALPAKLPTPPALPPPALPPSAPAPVGPWDALRAGDRLLKRALPEAIEAFAAAQQLDPLCAEAHLCAGLALHLAGDALAAEEALQKSLELDGTSWAASFYRALCLETLGRRDEARACYAAALVPTGDLGRLDGLGLELAAELHAYRADLLALAARRSATR